MNCDGGPPCSYGYGDYQCYGDREGCTPDDGNQCDSCCDQQRSCSGWFNAEYLRWRLDGSKLPPLLTEGSANTPLNEVARLDDPGTTILNDRRVGDDWRNGYRLSGGFWLDCCHTCGVGVDYFDIGNDDYNFTSPQDPSIIVGRPFFNTQTGSDDAQLVSVPNELEGTAHIRSTDNLEGAGLTFNRCLWSCCNPCCGVSEGVSAIGGYRFYRYDTNLSITENLTVLPGTTSPLVPGTTFFVQDSFRTRNDFNGGELGLQAYKLRKWWWLDGMAKVGLGQVVRTVTVNGVTITNVPGGGTDTEAGGLLTSSVTNIGQYRDTDFAVIPEFRLGVGVKVTECCSVRCGYNCIIWDDVARAADHLPPGLAVDPNNIPPVQAGGGPDPAFPGIHGSNLVAQGIDASVQFQW